MTEIRSDSAGIYVEAGGRYARPLRGQAAGLEAGKHVRAALNADETEIRVRWGGNEELWPAHVSRRASRGSVLPDVIPYEVGQAYELEDGSVWLVVKVYDADHKYNTQYNIGAQLNNGEFYSLQGHMGSAKHMHAPGNPRNIKRLVRGA